MADVIDIWTAHPTQRFDRRGMNVDVDTSACAPQQALASLDRLLPADATGAVGL